MLYRLFDKSDYERSLRQRRWIGFGLLAVGITGLLCYIFLVHDSDALPEFTRGFYLGGASGISLGAVFLLIRTTYLLTNPEARKKAKIQEQDEREKTIIMRSFQFAGVFTFFASAAALFVLVAVNQAAALTLLSVVAVFSITWLFRMLYLSKTL